MADLLCNGLHEQWGNAVSDPRPLLGELAFQFESLGEGRHQLDLAYRQVPDLVGLCCGRSYVLLPKIPG